MKISKLLKNVDYTEKNFTTDYEIEFLTTSSLSNCKNAIFFAIKGSRNDGNLYIKDALKKGAKVIVTNKKPKIKCNYIICNDVNLLKGQIAYNFYQIKNSIKLIGVVGTNGKTSITYMLKHIFDYANKKVGIIGTLGAVFNGEKIDYEMTTPDAITICKILSEMQKSGVEYCFIEVSAHAIFQKRVSFLYFETLIFTNCTHDHLDYFKTFDEYKNVKKSIFNKQFCKYAVINTDDPIGFEIIKESNADNYVYGLNNPSDVFAVKIEQKLNSLSFTVNLFDYIDFITVKTVGIYNVYNILASLTASVLNGISHKQAICSLDSFNGVEGRNELVAIFNGARIYVDYAHTPDGIKNTLLSFKNICKGKLVVIFGCGGNRDGTKRSVMGEIAGEIASFTIITSDNPRYEEPLKIINQIEKGVKSKTSKYATVENRYLATTYGVKLLNNGDILCILGKGAETYQEIKGVKYPYSDKQAVKSIIYKIKNGGENS